MRPVSAVAAAVVGGAWYVSSGATAPPAGPVRRVTVQLPVPLSTSTTGGGSAISIAADGSAIAFTGRGATGANQIGPGVVEVRVDQEVFLFGPTRRHDAVRR